MSTGELMRLRKKLIKLSNEILNIEFESENCEDSYPGGYIFELFKKAGVSVIFDDIFACIRYVQYFVCVCFTDK